MVRTETYVKALALMGALTSCSTSHLPPVQNKYTETLNQNPDIRLRQYVVKSEAAGVADLRRTLARTIYEESFAFIPERMTWVEVGINERINLPTPIDPTFPGMYPGVITSLSYDRPALNALLDAHETIYLYHYHPGKTAELNFIFQSPFVGLAPYRRDRANLGAALDMMEKTVHVPSHEDLLSTLANAAYHRSRHPQGTLVSKIVSPYGVTEITASELLINRYKVYHPDFFKNKYLASEIDTVVGGTSYRLYWHARETPSAQALPENLFSNLFFTVRFIPFTD